MRKKLSRLLIQESNLPLLLEEEIFLEEWQEPVMGWIECKEIIWECWQRVLMV